MAPSDANWASKAAPPAGAVRPHVVHAVTNSPGDRAPFVGNHASASNREHVEFAERAAIADLAVRLAVAETTIRAYEHHAVTMIARTPISWQKFRWGDISPANARTISEVAASLPDGDSAAFAAFDSAVAENAAQLAPARFEAVARKLREQLVACGSSPATRI